MPFKISKRSLVIVIGGIIALLYFLTVRKETVPAVIVEQKILETEKPFRIEIVYPTIPGVDDFNAKAISIVEAQLNEFKKTSLETDSLRRITMTAEEYGNFNLNSPYYLSITYEKGIVSHKIVSMVFRIEHYTGGAHGNRAFIALNYHIADKKEITLADVFPPSTRGYLQKISDYCIQDLIKQIRELTGEAYEAYIDEVWIREGASPKTENFSNFLFDDKSITFYFPPYQIAPYALGDFKVVMGRN